MFKRLIMMLLFISGVSDNHAQSVSCPSVPSSRLVVGEQAQIVVAGGSNLRVTPNADTTLLNIIPTGEIIPVIDGPFCAGYAWWQVDYDGQRGWVAEGFADTYWIAPYIIQRAQIGTIRIELQPTLTDNILIERLPDPPRNQFVLEGYPVQSEQWIPFIVIFDTMPDDPPPLNDNIRSQERDLEIGTRAVEVRLPDNITASAVELIYHYSAQLDDGRFADAYLPITTPNLPLPYMPPDDEIEAYISDYLDISLSALEQLSDEAFTPTLPELDNMIQSLNFNAPIEESSQLSYATNGIQFSYHPLLATQITEELIQATDTIPRHISLTFVDYPADSGIIRIYSTEELDSNLILRMQQIVQRQPNNPPEIPIPSQSLMIESRTDLQYQRFVSGEGVRYLSDDTYYYQGLSDDGRLLVSAQFALNDEAILLSLLDSLITSLEFSAS